MEVEEVAQLLLAQDKTVSVAEACTCGLVGYLLGTVPGASQFFPGGVIAYTGGLKQSILGVSDELYNTKGSVSREMAIAMARGVRELTNTDFGISTTGVTGPAAGHSGLPIGSFSSKDNGAPLDQQVGDHLIQAPPHRFRNLQCVLALTGGVAVGRGWGDGSPDLDAPLGRHGQ